jgi:hypothetical protein
MTAAGISAGIAMARRLDAIEYWQERRQAVQRLIEYDPQPPLDRNAGLAVTGVIHRDGPEWDPALGCGRRI